MIGGKYSMAPSCYARVCEEKPKEYSDYENFKISWGKIEYYEVIKKLGRGKYSEVFDGQNVANNQRCIIKILKPIRKAKIRREVKILQILFDGPNVVKLLDVVKDPLTGTPSLIYEAINNIDFRDLYSTLTDFDVRFYTYEILKTLDYCHSQGIMHRDIKPQNIIVDHSQRILRVIDWGLAEFYHQGTEYNVRVASRYYKGPELLIDDKLYDYSLDIWCLGCTFGEMIFKKIPLFKGSSNQDQLVKIVKVLGTKGLKSCIAKYELTLDPETSPEIENCPEISWESFVTPENKHLANSDAIDLLKKMLLYDKAERITAKEAMNHPYFLPVLKHLEKKQKT